MMLSAQTDVINPAISGNVALVRRGSCALETKFDNVLAVGAHGRGSTGCISGDISRQQMLHMLLTIDAVDNAININAVIHAAANMSALSCAHPESQPIPRNPDPNPTTTSE